MHINDILHLERTRRFKAFDKDVEVLLSAGCAGNWYFDWITDCFGVIKSHIGVEYYSPKPDSLPPNVTWIKNTVGDMSDVRTASCDLLISGQNIEHLWPDEMYQFFLEANRVLKVGGNAIIDSPHRDHTARLKWSHPEHMFELTFTEAKYLAQLAGFDVVNEYGILLMRNKNTKELFSLSLENYTDDRAECSRLIEAEENPDDSFIWWLELRKSERQPNNVKLKKEIEGIFQDAWPERTQRFASNVGIVTKEHAVASEKDTGALIFGPYMPLPKGKYIAEFNIELPSKSSAGVLLSCDIHGEKLGVICTLDITQEDIERNNGLVQLHFELEELEFGIQTRCFVHGKSAIKCHLPVILSPNLPEYNK